jgi:ribosomal protein S18 acetylase RimI-like enzyme
VTGYRTRQGLREDLASILHVQTNAFLRVAKQHDIDPGLLQPLQETVADLQRLFDSGTRFFVAVDERDTLIGSVRASSIDDRVEIGKLVVDDGWTRRGVATALMDLLERSYEPRTRLRLFTGADATAPLSLYTARGYAEYSREKIPGVELVWLEKVTPG